MTAKILCTIRDAKANSCGVPVCFSTEDEAVRAFCDLLSDGDTLMGKHPGDFALIMIADYFQDNGVISPLKDPVILCDGASYNSNCK